MKVRRSVIFKELTMSHSNPSHSQLSEEFMLEFSKKRDNLNLQINQLSPGISKDINASLSTISGEIQNLTKELHDAVLFLPSYSVKIRQNEIRDLEKALKDKEDSLVPRKRFGFKSKPPVSEKELEPASISSSNVNEAVITNIPSSDNYFTIEGIQDKVITYSDKELEGNDVQVKNCSGAVLLLAGVPSTLRLVNLKHCKLLCGPVRTSVFVDEVQDSELHLCCRQLRTHSSKKVDIYLRVVSRAIIEDSNEIRFGPYRWDHAKAEELHLKADISHTLERYDAVDDFNWLSSTPSPNWSIIPPGEYATFNEQS